MADRTVELRAASHEDLVWLQRLAAHPSVASVLAVDAVERLPAALAGGELVVAVASGAAVGAAQLSVRNRRSRIAELQTVMLEPAARGRGLGVATVQAAAAEVLGRRGMHRVEADVYGFNHAALRTFAAAGFVREGVRREAYDRHGARHDVALRRRRPAVRRPPRPTAATRSPPPPAAVAATPVDGTPQPAQRRPQALTSATESVTRSGRPAAARSWRPTLA